MAKILDFQEREHGVRKVDLLVKHAFALSTFLLSKSTTTFHRTVTIRHLTLTTFIINPTKID